MDNVSQKLKAQLQEMKTDEDNFYKVIQCKDINQTNLNTTADIAISVSK